MNDHTVTLTIGGMHSQDCVRKVAEAVLGVEGVDDAVVEFENRKVIVKLNKYEPADEQHLAEAVREAGYGLERVDFHAAHPPIA